MIEKHNINQDVWKHIRSDSALQKDLRRGIINIRALAKHLLDKYHYKSSLDAVISAIRRYETAEPHKEEDKKLERIFHDAVVSTKNNVACITLDTTPKQAIISLATVHNSKRIKIISGTDVIKLITEQPHLKEILSAYKKEEVERVDERLSEIRVIVSKQALQTKGVLARLATDLALANINIKEMVICPPEFFIYVDEDDIVKAHASVIQLCKEFLG